MAEPVRYQPGSIALLGVDLVNELGVAADPDVDIRIRILDDLGAVVVDVTEAIGGLVSIENPAVGRYQYRHTVTTNDPTADTLWQHEWTGTSATPPAPTVKGKPSCFIVEATDFPVP